jgi:putative radical SAM enzyme (TIGR03279 family)
MGGVISSIKDGSIGAKFGLRPGDELISINGHPLRDVIDYTFYGAEEELEIIFIRDGRRIALRVRRDYEEDLGIDFAEPTFDGVRLCNNRCFFCFVDQLPKGMRRSLYIKDDDIRLSFLFGNFVTLTNLNEADWERLAEQRLSPLYISVHATDLKLRRRLLGNPSAPDVIEQIRRLGELGIQVHAQIVLIPGLNDGEHLSRTVASLAALHPTVQSIAVIPLGLTKHHPPGLRPYSPDEARAIVAQVKSWQNKYRGRCGLGLVYASDEWYLLAGEEVPKADEYDGFPQLENGVGLTRLLLDEGVQVGGVTLGKSQLMESAASCADESPIPRCRSLVTLVCGKLIAPVLEGKAVELSEVFGMEVDVLPVENRFFGPTVTVSGLLTGRDVVEALRERELGEVVFLPRAMFDSAGERTLDDMSLAEIREELGVRVEFAGTMGEVVERLWGDLRGM